MQQLTDHEKKILELVRKHPEIVDDRSARKKIADEVDISEKTLRNRIADLKRFGLIGQGLEEQTYNKKDDTIFVDNMVLLWKKRRFIFLNTFIFAIISIVISLLLPKWYRSQAIIMSTGVQPTNFVSLLTGVPSANFGLSSVDKDISNYIAILESRTVGENMVNRFDLMDRYGTPEVEKSIKVWLRKLELEITEEGTLIISVLDKDPIVARDMVTALLQELEETNLRLSREKGKFNRQFYEERLAVNRAELVNAEEKLRIFQKKNGTIDIPSQVIAAIETYSKLYAKKVDVETQLAVSNAILAKSDPKINQLEIFLKELNSKLAQMASGGVEESVLLVFDKVPDLSLEYARLLREVEVQNKILEVIIPQYEQARMEESKDIPSIQVLDKPNVPINKAKPKRAIIVIATIVMAAIMSVVFVLFWERTHDVRLRLKDI